MAEYIEREAVLAICREMSACEWNHRVSPVSWADAYEQFGDDVEEIPAADVVERKRGEWEFVEQRFYHGGFINLFRCSECSAATDKEYNFCPNCGANMRGDTDA